MMRRNRKSKPLRERLLARIDKTPGFGPHGECWRWNGAHTKGRPVIGVTVNGKKKKLFVARVIYEETIGPIPRGKELDHTCRFKACANPYHLEPVTHMVNCQRWWQKTHCVKGHPRTPNNLQGRGCRTCNNERRRKVRAA